MSNNIISNEYNPFQKWKVLAHYERMLKIQTGNFAPPVFVGLFPIQGISTKKKCGGFNCNYCISDFEETAVEASYPKDVFLSLPKFFHDWGVLSATLSGHNSDPLAYNHDTLIEFLRLWNGHHLDIGIISNGILYTDNLIEDVARNANWSGWSMNSGKSETHAKISCTKEGTFDKVVSNIVKTAEYRDKHKLKHQIGYKFLILDKNFDEIIDAVKLAKSIGINQMQIRPAELPFDRASKIDSKIVEDQMREAMSFAVPGKFDIYGIREKFTTDFTKRVPKRCIASPLGTTWKADGDVALCCDRMWDTHIEGFSLGNFIEEGPEAIRRKWGSADHKKMIDNINNTLDKCIRCTYYNWHVIYENCVNEDKLDVNLI